MDGDVDVDLLVASDRQEVDVEELTADVVALDLAGHGEVTILPDVEVDEHVGPCVGVQGVVQLASVDRDLDGLHPVPVQDPRNAPLRAELAGGSLSSAVPQDGFELP